MKPAQVRAIFNAFQAADPDPRTELRYKNPFTLLVAIVLSAQATDVSVNKATEPLFAKADTPGEILALGEAGLKNYIKTIGLYNAKARNVMALCQMLIDTFGGAIPRDRETLQTLPGVGRKTANVWLNCIHNEPTIAVDTHVFRVANRTGLTNGANPLAVELQLEATIPKPYLIHAHHWLILHGRYVCKARRPECYRCIIAKWCEYPEKTLEA